MTWTVVLPLKAAGRRKSRLSSHLDAAARDRLTLSLLDHVVNVVASQARVLLLAPAVPDGWRHDWVIDHGAGLNAELAAATAERPRPIAIIHPDLPLLRQADIVDLFTAATASGFALAPDRHGIGTNALAIADGRTIDYRFGKGSLARFCEPAGAAPVIVRRAGLALDLDTPDDLERAEEAGAACLAQALCARR